MYVCMYVCVCVCMYAHTYACMYAYSVYVFFIDHLSVGHGASERTDFLDFVVLLIAGTEEDVSGVGRWPYYHTMAEPGFGTLSLRDSDIPGNRARCLMKVQFQECC